MVIDASIGVKWLIPESDSAVANGLAEQGDLLVPTLFHVEVGNALWKKVRRHQIDLSLVLPFFRELPSLVQTICETDHVGRAAEIAVELSHPIYDCIYLAVAEAQRDSLVTADERFLERVQDTRFEPLVVPLATLHP